MRADRLLSLLMLLETRGKLTARQLAEELEVSERTIYRHIVALSTSGVPIYTEELRRLRPDPEISSEWMEKAWRALVSPFQKRRSVSWEGRRIAGFSGVPVLHATSSGITWMRNGFPSPATKV